MTDKQKQCLLVYLGYDTGGVDGDLREPCWNPGRSYPVQREHGPGIRQVLHPGLCCLPLYP